MPPILSSKTTLAAAACAALVCRDVDEKLRLVQSAVRALEQGEVEATGAFLPAAPQTPGRPERPHLVAPRALERRSTATATGHAVLVHAVTHIEFNAINLALDVLCRFPEMPPEFYLDWLGIAREEAMHFEMLRGHLRGLGHEYGDFPAHDGLWQMAVKTAHDPLVRMALVPRVLEARGLDASPGMIRRLREAGDERGAEIIALILRDEVGHVAAGSRWFNALCAQRGLDAEKTFEILLSAYDAPRAVLPLNLEARRLALFTPGELARIGEIASRRSRPTAR